ncbi:MAG: twin-arginine translocase subunit TatC [Candidatus Gastranaerophilales bacterium]|nr:twin-arginine translocase subunit TatC [Candidatus Gastranaerophilales bacterium]
MTDKDESIITHIEAFRQMLIKCIIAIATGIIPMLFISPKCIDLFIKIILKNNNIVLNYFSPMDVFIIQIKTALILDLIVCFPYISKQVWNFFVPALYEHEKKFIKSIILSSSTLFILGSIFCLFVILPLIINFGLSFSTSNIHAVFGIVNVVNMSLWLILAFGVMFQFPLITYSLIKSEMVSYKTITNTRPYVVVGILISAAILTPPDIISQILLFMPTYLLFELGLLLARRKKENDK